MAQKPQSVLIDALVVMKILKHAGDSPHEAAQGPLLGLVVDDIFGKDKCLEVTNCFPLPDEDDGSNYQFQMMRWLRTVNIDHMHVGWYQVSELGSFFNEDVVMAQYEHQAQIAESVVLIYDPVVTSQGSLLIKAYRLTDEAMRVIERKDFSAAGLKEHKLSYNNMFEEVPVALKMSPLAKLLVPELTSKLDMEQFDRLDLGTNAFMEKNIRHLMERIEELGTEANKFQTYFKKVQKQEESINARLSNLERENEERRDRKQAPLTEADVRGMYKREAPPSRLESLLINAQIKNYCQQVSQFSSQSFGKLYLAQAIQPAQQQTE